MAGFENESQLIEWLKAAHIQMSKDPSARGRLVKALTGNTTSREMISALIRGTKLHSMPYYKEHFALELLPILDAMIEDRKDREYRFCDYSGMKPYSLYLKIYQSFQWIIDNADTEEAKYLRLYNDIEIRAKSNSNRTGIKLIFKTTSKAKLDKAHIIDGSITPKKWKEEVYKFLADGVEGTQLLIDKLSLTDEEVNELQVTLSQLTNILARVNGTSIKIIKPTAEQLAEMKQV